MVQQIAETPMNVREARTANSDAFDPTGRTTGFLLVATALMTTVFNLTFPRVQDPLDTVAVLTMMVENETMRQLSFLGVLVGFWGVTTGIILIATVIHRTTGSRLALCSNYVAVSGAAIFSMSMGLGLVTTHAAVAWNESGAVIGDSAYAIAAGLNAADDGVWAISIIVFWSALVLLGLAMVRDSTLPWWISWPLLTIGSATVLFAGVPMAFNGISGTSILAFAALAQSTLIWALATGIWLIRTSH